MQGYIYFWCHGCKNHHNETVSVIYKKNYMSEQIRDRLSPSIPAIKVTVFFFFKEADELKFQQNYWFPLADHWKTVQNSESAHLIYFIIK